MFIVLGLFVVFLYPPMQKMQYNKLSYTVAFCWSYCKNCAMMHGNMNVKMWHISHRQEVRVKNHCPVR
jgi:hypothetical protein